MIRACIHPLTRTTKHNVGFSASHGRAKKLKSLFATREGELLGQRKFKAEACMAIFRFIVGWYNPARRHPAVGYMSPINSLPSGKCARSMQLPHCGRFNNGFRLL